MTHLQRISRTAVGGESVGLLLLRPVVVERVHQQYAGLGGGVGGCVDVGNQRVPEAVGLEEQLRVGVFPHPRLAVRAVHAKDRAPRACETRDPL